MFESMIRYFSTKPKQNMKPIELKTSPEQMQTITKLMILGTKSSSGGWIKRAYKQEAHEDRVEMD
ncbi:Serine/threonine-protein kinase tousled-like 1 [Gossypium arboreum]|uniref:Serine/threonine-protein kinase tousled-like 1 n=1 Tax=Gossypium arboreum TaxID=29729 RepID=A0A0B0MEY1_GOSAR|nr:Serine/threonine-protein kinase tousled-like 1 [Gossypium arboreum]